MLVNEDLYWPVRGVVKGGVQALTAQHSVPLAVATLVSQRHKSAISWHGRGETIRDGDHNVAGMSIWPSCRFSFQMLFAPKRLLRAACPATPPSTTAQARPCP